LILDLTQQGQEPIHTIRSSGRVPKIRKARGPGQEVVDETDGLVDMA
jgi:hypothetical protein